MAVDTASDILAFKKQGTGNNLNTWGDELNNALDRISEAIADRTVKSLTGNYTLTSTNYVQNESRSAALVFSDGGLSSAPTVTLPARKKLYWAQNTGSTYSVTIGVSGGTSVTIPTGSKWVLVLSDGTDCEKIDLSNFGGELSVSSIEDIATSRVIGNMSGSTAAPSLITVYDEDDMSSDSATGLATQQSIKAYVDTSIASGDVAVVAANISDVQAVAAIDSDVTAVAADAADIGTVSTNIVSVNNCATNIADIQDAANLFGDVVQGPASATDSALVRYDGTTGQLVKDGPSIGTSANNIVQLDGSGALPAVDGSNLTGLQAGGLILISEQTVSSAVAAVDITSGIDSTYEEYEIHLLGFKPATDNTSLYLRTSTDGGSTFDSGASDYGWTACNSRTNSNSLSPSGVSAASAIQLDGYYNVHTDANCDGVDAVIRLFRPSEAAYTRVFFHIINPRTALTDESFNQGMGVRASATDTDAIRLLFSSGNIASGTIRLYGVRKS